MKLHGGKFKKETSSKKCDQCLRRLHFLNVSTKPCNIPKSKIERPTFLQFFFVFVFGIGEGLAIFLLILQNFPKLILR